MWDWQEYESMIKGHYLPEDAQRMIDKTLELLRENLVAVPECWYLEEELFEI